MLSLMSNIPIPSLSRREKGMETSVLLLNLGLNPINAPDQNKPLKAGPALPQTCRKARQRQTWRQGGGRASPWVDWPGEGVDHGFSTYTGS